MTPTSTAQGPVIDLTGLPDNAVQAVRTIVEALRQREATRQLRGCESPRTFDDCERVPIRLADNAIAHLLVERVAKR